MDRLYTEIDKSCGIHQTNNTFPFDDCARIDIACESFQRGFFNPSPIQATLCWHFEPLLYIDGNSPCVKTAIKEVIPPVTQTDKAIFAGIGVGAGACLSALITCCFFANRAKQVKQNNETLPLVDTDTPKTKYTS